MKKNHYINTKNNINIKEVAASKIDGDNESNWLTPELIPVKPVYSKEDIN